MKQCNATIKNFKNGHPLTPLVLSSPHSGKFYPKEFLKLSQIPIETLKQSEDSLVDDLLSTNSANNNVLLSANWSRSVIDVNRAINDFNENNFDPPITKYKSIPSKYSRSGLGVIPSRSINNELIYKNLIPGDISTEWLDKAWNSYHDSLKKILNRVFEIYGYYILFDFHSMPSRTYLGNNPDIVLGDCYGSSISPNIIIYVKKLFLNSGLKVKLNDPYSGGYITENYGLPKKGFHTLQIEINRSLYLNEKTREKNHNFNYLQKLLMDLIKNFEKEKNKLLK